MLNDEPEAHGYAVSRAIASYAWSISMEAFHAHMKDLDGNGIEHVATEILVRNAIYQGDRKNNDLTQKHPHALRSRYSGNRTLDENVIPCSFIPKASPASEAG